MGDRARRVTGQARAMKVFDRVRELGWISERRGIELGGLTRTEVEQIVRRGDGSRERRGSFDAKQRRSDLEQEAAGARGLALGERTFDRVTKRRDTSAHLRVLGGR